MNVGITYDLRDDYLAEGFGEEATAEFDRPDTIEAIACTLQSLGYGTDRIGNVRHLTSRLAAGDRWDIVFNIAEGLRGYGREAQVPALLDAYGIPYTFSDPLTLCLTLHKGMTKRVLRDLEIPTPDWALVENPDDIATVRLPYPLFAKPAAEGTGKGITAASKIGNPAQLRDVCTMLLARYQQPVLVETFLPGRELTVGILGSGNEATVIAVLEVVLKDSAEVDVYSYVNKEECERLVEYRLAHDDLAASAARTALDAWKGLSCLDAGRVDLRADAMGIPHVLEINPLAGLHPHHSDLPILCTLAGMSYKNLLRRIMESALKRATLASPEAKVKNIPTYTPRVSTAMR